MDNETLQALERIESGGGNDHDRNIVRRALLSVAPSSQTYKRLARAAGPSSLPDTNLPVISGPQRIGPVAGSTQLPFSGQQRPSSPGQPDGMFGTPTLDFLGGAAGRMPAQPGADPSAPTDLVGAARAGVGPNIADAYQPGPSPTLDFLQGPDGRLAGLPQDAPPAAAAFDAPPGADVRQGNSASFNTSGRPFGLGTTNANHNLAATSDYRAMLPQDQSQTQAADPTAAINENSPADIFANMPAGYSFSDMNRAGIQDMLTNPERYATTFARGHGGEQYAGLYADPAKAAIALSSSGIYGPGGTSIGNNMQSTNGMPIGQRLQAVEDFMNQYTTKGVDIRPEEIYSQMFGRLQNTDLSQVESPQTHLPMQTGEIIDYTNSSLMAAAPFMTPEGQSWISSILANAGNQYMDYIGSTDEADPMSYPAFLQSIGVDKLMQGQ